MKSPSKLDDLPFASELTPFPDSDLLEFDGDYDRVLFAGRTLADADAGGARFTECAFTGGTGFDGGHLRRSRFSDVWLAETRLVVRDALRAAERAGTPATLVDARPVVAGLVPADAPEPDLGDGPHVQLWPHRHGTDAMHLSLLRRDAS